MTISEDDLISAQVLLASASGQIIGPDTMITSENISDYQPAPETTAEALKAFRSLGFEVGPMVGISFSITAGAALFEQVFNVPLHKTPAGGFETGTATAPGGPELPVPELPQSLAKKIIAITFVPPPDFGPNNY